MNKEDVIQFKFMAQIQKISDRDSRARLTTYINLINQAIQIAIGLLSVPLTINYLSADLFSIWMALVSIVTLLAFSDFGVGIGLQNRLTEAISRNDRALARKVTINSIAFALFLSALIFFSAYIAIPKFDWKNYLKLNAATSEILIEQAVLLITATTIIGIFANILQRIVISFQEGFWVAFFQCITRILVLIAMYFVVMQDGGFLLLIFSIQGLGHVIQITLLSIYIFQKKGWLLNFSQNSNGYLDKSCLIDIIKIGSLGLGASLAYFIATNSIPIALTNRFGAASITEYMVLIKITSIPIMLATHLYSPIWPAVTDAMIKGDKEWIAKSMRKNAFILLVLISTSSLFLFEFINLILQFWLKSKSINPDGNLIFACLFMMALYMWNAYISTYLNGLGRYKSQASAGLVFAIISFVIACGLELKLNPIQVIWIIIMGYLARCIYLQIELAFVYNNTLRK